MRLEGNSFFHGPLVLQMLLRLLQLCKSKELSVYVYAGIQCLVSALLVQKRSVELV